MFKEYNEYVKEQAEASGARVSVLVCDLKKGETLASYKPELRMVSASTIKTPIMLYALKQVMDGKLSLDMKVKVPADIILDDSSVFEYGETEMKLEDIITWMVINSDNTATNVVVNLLGREGMNKYFKEELKLSETVDMRQMLDFEAIAQGRNNYTSAADMLIVYKAIYEKTVLTPELCDKAMSILFRNRDYKLFMRYINDSVKLAHKTGGLDFLEHDTGIAFLPSGDYFFGFFVSDIPVEAEAGKLIGRLARKFYDTVTR